MSFNLARKSVVDLAVRVPAGTRFFHSPFVVLGKSPLTTPPSESTKISSQYEKQYDHPAEPIRSHSGYRTYVVSQPDEAYKHYQVPAGAYPTSSPYIQFKATNAPDLGGAQSASTNQMAHSYTTRAAPQHPGGVGESSSILYKSVPGEMGARGGGFGGLKVMDMEGTMSGRKGRMG